MVRYLRIPWCFSLLNESKCSDNEVTVMHQVNFNSVYQIARNDRHDERSMFKHQMSSCKWIITHNIDCLARFKYRLLIIRRVFSIGCSSKPQIRFETCSIHCLACRSDGLKKLTQDLNPFFRIPFDQFFDQTRLKSCLCLTGTPNRKNAWQNEQTIFIFT
jgi:hypothetical protein